jgi:hypothetical protein
MKAARSAPAQSVSLTRFLLEDSRAQGQINAGLRLLIEVIARACKTISIVFPGSENEADRATRYHREATA